MNKIKNISFLFFACSDRRPNTLTPAHAGITTGTLRYPAVNHGMANLSFSAIISRLDIRVCQKTKICFSRFTLKSASQFFSKFMIWRSSHFAQKTSLNLLHTPCKPDFSQFITAMQCFKQLSNPIKQFAAPAAQFLVRMFGKKTYLTDKMSHTVLNHRIAESCKLSICSPVITTNDSFGFENTMSSVYLRCPYGRSRRFQDKTHSASVRQPADKQA